MKKHYLTCCLILAIPLMAVTCNRPMKKEKNPLLSSIKLPAGFEIAVYAKVDNARSMALGDKGTVFVGNRDGKKVYALVDADVDGVAEKVYTVADNLDTPNGVAFRKGTLYIAGISQIWKLDNIEDKLENPPAPVPFFTKLPDKSHHGWKYIAFGPDDKLYIPIGAPCNICNDAEKDARFASISRVNADGSNFEVFADGVRNSVGFDWHPQTKELWFTENGRDMMGDDQPADELNRAPAPGMHFGYPYFHQGTIPDPDFAKGKNASDYIPPVANLHPHGAALGMKFYTGSMFPEAYKNQIILAEHGSWNRSKPIGYQLSLVKLNGNKLAEYATFASGWLKNGKAWGRPVDVLQLKDGSLLVSDDFANLVYRITYNGQAE
ncbi:sorbosone dehydrogenase [Pedobacter yulinensis]|uniref:Sorbosone dehydrogenase n=1 Tax=Pedobacter yulinensis TaxID=2126353 RepID=A0A2T3HNM3_9SPHI|nr:PQQ-dependent sugar dehydrogenase [Pedobacter yulinensis]PST84007.1 sorbosone dehydrogenase [Pedobacter yulinensis]